MDTWSSSLVAERSKFTLYTMTWNPSPTDWLYLDVRVGGMGAVRRWRCTSGQLPGPLKDDFTISESQVGMNSGPDS